MLRKWAFKTLKGIAELNEAALRMDASLSGLVSDGRKVTSFGKHLCLPERSSNQLHTATLRADKLRRSLRGLLADLGSRLNICEVDDTLLAQYGRYANGESAVFKFTRNDTIRYLDGLLKLLRQAKAIGAAIEIACTDIEEHLESLIPDGSMDCSSVESLTDDVNGSIDSEPPLTLHESLDMAVQDLSFTSRVETNLLRELAADVLDVKTSLLVTSADNEVMRDSDNF